MTEGVKVITVRGVNWVELSWPDSIWSRVWASFVWDELNSHMWQIGLALVWNPKVLSRPAYGTDPNQPHGAGRAMSCPKFIYIFCCSARISLFFLNFQFGWTSQASLGPKFEPNGLDFRLKQAMLCWRAELHLMSIASPARGVLWIMLITEWSDPI